MKNKIVALFASLGMIFAGAVAIAPAANAHASLCQNTITAPVRVGNTGIYIAGSASTKMPVDPHQRRCGLTAQLQVWSPSAKGGGSWRNYGLADADFTSTLRRATVTPTAALLYGPNLYRLKVNHWADGPAGTVERPTKYSVPVRFNRLPVRR